MSLSYSSPRTFCRNCRGVLKGMAYRRTHVSSYSILSLSYSWSVSLVKGERILSSFGWGRHLAAAERASGREEGKEGKREG